MKLHASLFAAAVLATALTTGCQSSPSMTNRDTAPAIMTDATRKDMTAGETVTVTATTMNVVGSRSAIKWSVLPDNSKAKVTAVKDNDNKSALFTSSQAGTYIVRASVNTEGDHWINSDTTIVVNAAPGTVYPGH